MKPASLLALPMLLWAVMAVPAQAQTQTVINPRTVEFDPSADHNAVTAANQPVVQRYDLQIFTVSGTTPYTTGNLGKPAPQSDGKIRVDFSTLVTPWPLPDGSYQARVAAIGPTGNASSDPSNTFAFQSQNCSYSVPTTPQSFPADGAAGTVTVTAGPGCAWTAASDSSWVVVTTPSGTGTAPVNFTVTTNVGATPRTAALTIAGQAVSVTQTAPVPCTYSISPTSGSFTPGGGSLAVAVTAGAGCSWTTSGSNSWATVGTGGTGNGSVTVNVTANDTTSTRSTTLTIAGQSFAVTESGLACSYSLSPGSQNFAEAGGTGSFTVTSAGACAWTATSGAPAWLTITSGSGSGGGIVTYSVSHNTLASPRTGTILVGSQTFTVSQAAAVVCTYSVSGTPQSFTSAPGTGSVGVTAPSGCGWTATSSAPDWLTVSIASGSGSGAAAFSVGANSTTSARSATLTVAGQAVNVTQDGLSCSFSLSPATELFGAAAETRSLTVGGPDACGWTATNSASWVTLGATSGKGGATVPVTVAANPNATERSASLTIAGKGFTVTQTAGTCSYSLTPTSRTFNQGSATGSIAVSCGSGCSWTASIPTDVTWVTLGTKSGSGAGTVTYTVAKNTTTAIRQTIITVGGQQYTLKQDAANRPSAPKKPRVTSVVGG